MSDQELVEHASPTMAGLKTGSLFLCRYEDRGEFIGEVRDYNRRFAGKGVSIVPLYMREDRALVYAFRMTHLTADLQKEDARKILSEDGYDCSDAGKCIRRLAEQFETGDSFPHEVGLFLSYPPEDVAGFIRNHAANCKYTGLWKVYGDVDSAKRTFAKYRKCTACYSRFLEKNGCIEKLLVAD